MTCVMMLVLLVGVKIELFKGTDVQQGVTVMPEINMTNVER